MVEITFDDTNIQAHLNESLWVDLESEYDHIGRPILTKFRKMFFIEYVDYYVFCEQLHNWFIDNNIEYKLFWVGLTETGIQLKKDSDAILFKLTWG
jgi:hypothetical protein